MNTPCTILLSWVGLAALSLAACAFIVQGELRIDAHAMTSPQASHSMVYEAMPEQDRCGLTSSLAGR